MASASMPLKCSNCRSRAKCEWSVLSDEEVAILDEAKTIKSFKKGEMVFMESQPCDGLYYIASGQVSLYKSDEDGDTAILRLSGVGETLGYQSVLTGADCLTSAEALISSQICFIPGATVRALLARNLDLAAKFLDHSVADFREVGERYLRLATGTVRSRFGYYLRTLEKTNGAEDPNGDLVIDLPVSRQDIATLIDTRPETLSRAIRCMVTEGLAEFDARSVKILAPEILFGGEVQMGHCQTFYFLGPALASAFPDFPGRLLVLVS